MVSFKKGGRGCLHTAGVAGSIPASPTINSCKQINSTLEYDFSPILHNRTVTAEDTLQRFYPIQSAINVFSLGSCPCRAGCLMWFYCLELLKEKYDDQENKK